MRETMRTLCRRARLHYCDLLGQPIDAVARVSGQAAKMTPGSRPPLNSAYFKRMEAIEFAVRFDDGVAQGLHDADVVLVGVSRTSKTPLSIYLGYLGHKAANVPVVKGIEPPQELFEIDQAKVVGLTIDPNRLVEIRRARVRAMGAPGRNRQYAELIEIYEELEQADKLHRRLGCPVIDISELSIEETAHRVLRVVEERRGERRRRARDEPQAADPALLLAPLVARPSRRGRRLLRPAHADLDRPARARLGRGVPARRRR